MIESQEGECRDRFVVTERSFPLLPPLKRDEAAMARRKSTPPGDEATEVNAERKKLEKRKYDITSLEDLTYLARYVRYSVLGIDGREFKGQELLRMVHPQLFSDSLTQTVEMTANTEGSSSTMSDVDDSRNGAFGRDKTQWTIPEKRSQSILSRLDATLAQLYPAWTGDEATRFRFARSFTAAADAVLRGAELLKRPVASPGQSVRVLCTPSVATSFMPRVVNFLVHTRQWLTNFSAYRLCVHHIMELDVSLHEVFTGTATCLIGEQIAVERARELQIPLHVIPLFGCGRQGFIFRNDIPFKTLLKTTGNLGFLRDYIFWVPQEPPLWETLKLLLPEPAPPSGGRVEMYTFNSIRAAVLAVGGVGVGSYWPGDAPWGFGPDKIGFVAFEELPESVESSPRDEGILKKIQSRDRQRFYLLVRQQFIQAERNAKKEEGKKKAEGGEKQSDFGVIPLINEKFPCQLSKGEEEVVKTISEASHLYAHAFVS